MTSIKTFKAKKTVFEFLTPNEKKILPLLLAAARDVDKIFRLQENPVNNGANFYPRDAIKKEIELAAKNNPRIFSPATVVKRNKNKKLIAVDYHIEYRKLLIPISKKLKQAARICQNKNFKHYSLIFNPLFLYFFILSFSNILIVSKNLLSFLKYSSRVKTAAARLIFHEGKQHILELYYQMLNRNPFLFHLYSVLLSIRTLIVKNQMAEFQFRLCRTNLIG